MEKKFEREKRRRRRRRRRKKLYDKHIDSIETICHRDSIAREGFISKEEYMFIY
jgi:hypothetical protein